MLKKPSDNKIKPLTVAHIQTIEYAIGLVRAEVGCALLPNIKQINQYEDVVFKPIDEFSLTRDIGLAYQDKLEEDGPLAELIKICQAR